MSPNNFRIMFNQILILQIWRAVKSIKVNKTLELFVDMTKFKLVYKHAIDQTIDYVIFRHYLQSLFVATMGTVTISRHINVRPSI